MKSPSCIELSIPIHVCVVVTRNAVESSRSALRAEESESNVMFGFSALRHDSGM